MGCRAPDRAEGLLLRHAAGHIEITSFHTWPSLETVQPRSILPRRPGIAHHADASIGEGKNLQAKPSGRSGEPARERQQPATPSPDWSTGHSISCIRAPSCPPGGTTTEPGPLYPRWRVLSRMIAGSTTSVCDARFES